MEKSTLEVRSVVPLASGVRCAALQRHMDCLAHVHGLDVCMCNSTPYLILSRPPTSDVQLASSASFSFCSLLFSCAALWAYITVQQHGLCWSKLIITFICWISAFPAGPLLSSPLRPAFSARRIQCLSSRTVHSYIRLVEYTFCVLYNTCASFTGAARRVRVRFGSVRFGRQLCTCVVLC